MNPSELRIGNFVYTGSKGLTEVVSIDDRGINLQVSGGYYVGDYELDYDGYFEEEWYKGAIIKGIPLMPDLKEKGLNMLSGNIADAVADWVENNNPPLHLFQNIIYCLTGEELKVRS